MILIQPPVVQNWNSLVNKPSILSDNQISWDEIQNKPTTLTGYGITNGQPLGNELTALQSLADTPGFLKKTGDGTYSIDINSYLSLAGGTLTGALIATSFSGVGTALTALNASNISTGTINAARLPASYLPLTGGTITGDLVSTSATVSTSPTTGAIRGASLGVTGDVNAYTVSASELTVSSIYPGIWLNESKALTNKKLWYLVVDGEVLQFQTRDDNGNYLGGPLSVSRAGTTTTTDMIVSAATPSTSPTTGASRVTGGQGIGGDQWVGGAVNTATFFRVGGTQVVSTRRTGWTAPTGTPTRTTFVTSTVTLTGLAERVKALIDDLITHGLIGA
jgi:hypothetical protein